MSTHSEHHNLSRESKDILHGSMNHPSVHDDNDGYGSSNYQEKDLTNSQENNLPSSGYDPSSKASDVSFQQEPYPDKHSQNTTQMPSTHMDEQEHGNISQESIGSIESIEDDPLQKTQFLQQRKNYMSTNSIPDHVSEQHTIPSTHLMYNNQHQFTISSNSSTDRIHSPTPYGVSSQQNRFAKSDAKEVHALNSRIEQLENVVVHLNNQIKILKKLLLAQVNDSRKYLEEEIEDVRQAVIKQDKLYMDLFLRIEKGETPTVTQSIDQSINSPRVSPIHSRRKSLFSAYKSDQLRRQELLEQKKRIIELNIQNDSLLGEIEDPEDSKSNRSTRSVNNVKDVKISLKNSMKDNSYLQSVDIRSTSKKDSQPTKRRVKRVAQKRASSAPRLLLSSDLKASGSIYKNRIQEQHLIGDRLNNADDEKMSQDTKYVLDTYKESIHRIFVHYCDSMLGFTKGKITLSKMQFYKFLQDIEIKRLVPDCNDELLWFRILRIVNLASTNRRQDNIRKELSEEHMYEVIRIIAKSIYRHSTMTEAQIVESTLISHIFPKVNEKIQEAPKCSTTIQSVMDLLNDAQRKRISILFKKHRSRLKESFRQCITTHYERPDLAITRKSMTSQQLIKFCQQYKILPLITKKELCSIHMIYAGSTNGSNVLKISYDDFENVLVEIANHIYGMPPYSLTYKDADQRLEKLFSKMFLLRD